MKRLSVLAAIALFPALRVHAAESLAPLGDLPVYGGPAYTSGAGGFQGGDITVISGNGVNSSGTAVGWADKYDASGKNLGTRAVRWDPFGTATELGDLGTSIGGSSTAAAYAVNAAGTTVGSAYKYDASGSYLGRRAVRWDRGGAAATELGNLGTNANGITVAYAIDINTPGTAVGYATKFVSGASLGFRAVRWDAAGIATELGTLGTRISGATDAYAYAVNTAGIAVGGARKFDDSDTDQGTRAVRWDAAGTATELGNLGTSTGGSTKSFASAVNPAGIAIGIARKYDASGRDLGYRPVRWDPWGTAATELGILGIPIDGPTDAIADAVNTAGTIVGTVSKYAPSGSDLGQRAVRWDATGTVATELGNLGTTIGGITYSSAQAINAAGIAVGNARAFDASGASLGPHATFWGADGVATDLNTLIDPAGGWTLVAARAISDTHFVSGIGSFDPDGNGPEEAYSRFFVMDISAAVPEPGSLGLFGHCAVGFLLRRSRRRSRSAR